VLATLRNSYGIHSKEVRTSQNYDFEVKIHLKSDKLKFPIPGLLRTIAMNLNLGICREEEKQVKKHALIDYMLSHLKVNYIAILIVRQMKLI